MVHQKTFENLIAMCVYLTTMHSPVTDLPGTGKHVGRDELNTCSRSSGA
jgi:hypothetical protein